MGNLMSKISSLFLSGSLTNLDMPAKSSLWGRIGVFFTNLFPWVWEIFARFIVAIIKFVLNIVDFFQYFVQQLVGINDWRAGTVNINNIGESDLIFKFIFHKNIQRAFRFMIGIFFVLLIVFTIIAIVKNEYAYASSSDGKASNDKTKIFKNAAKAVFLVFIIPLFIVMGILSSNAILASILNALSGGKHVTFGDQIFVASSYSANKYRAYAEAGVRIPITNSVAGSGGSLVSSALTNIVPAEYKSGSKFTGYMFELTFKDYLYYVEEDGDPQAVYKYITETLGGTIKWPDDVEYDAWGYDDQGIKIALNSCEKESDVNQAAYNTWTYNEILTRNFNFDETVTKTEVSDDNSLWESLGLSKNVLDDSDLWEGLGLTKTANVYTYANSGEWAMMHDGGANGLVALPQEYYANADVVDYMIKYGVELYVIDVRDFSINWNVDGLDAKFVARNFGNVFGGHFVVKYSDGEGVLYSPTSDLTKTSEAEGVNFIYAYKSIKEVDQTTGKITYEYIPMLHTCEAKLYLGTTKTTDPDTGDTIYSRSTETITMPAPQFDSLAYDYNGVVVARGVLDSTYSEVVGRPTQIVKNKTDIEYEREMIDEGKWHFDFCINILNLFGDGVNWRCKISLGDAFGDSEVKQASFSAKGGVISLDYNFAEENNNGLQFSTFFVGGKMNIIIYVFSAILVMIVLGQAVWGLIARIYDIALYFLVMPGVVATIPFESSKTNVLL